MLQKYAVIIDCPAQLKSLHILHQQNQISDVQYVIEVENFMNVLKSCLKKDNCQEECAVVDELGALFYFVVMFKFLKPIQGQFYNLSNSFIISTSIFLKSSINDVHLFFV